MRTYTIDDVSVPVFMYGTAWKEERTHELASAALAEGFSAIDTANQRRHYVEADVGRAVADAIQKGSLSREQLFLQTKFTYRAGQDQRLPYDPAARPRDQVRQSFESSLEHLQTRYVDSYVLHGPTYRRGLSEQDWEVWSEMQELKREGLARLIGVSNVALDQLALLQREAEIKPAFVQNRCFARAGWDGDVRAFCRQHDIRYQGFSLLTANERELSRPAVQRIAERHGRTIPQVTFAFALAVGMLPLTGTRDVEHMRQDLAAVELVLSDDEVSQIERIGL